MVLLFFAKFDVLLNIKKIDQVDLNGIAVRTKTFHFELLKISSYAENLRKGDLHS